MVNPTRNSIDGAPPAVSLIIPAYNEAENLPQLLGEAASAMQAQPRSWDIWVIDDGSTDNSRELLRGLADRDERIRYISFEANQGQSAAFAAGFQEAGGAVFVTLDADLQNDPADIPALLDMYDAGWDMAIGVRTRRQDTLLKRLASRFANAVRNALTRENVTDTGCSLKVMRASLARQLPMFKGMHRFFPTLMKMRGARVAEMPVRHRPRLHGVSKYGIWDRAFSGLYDLLAVRWMQSRNISYRIRERR